MTATMESKFSTMKYIKNGLCNQMNDYLVVCVGRYVVGSIDNEAIIQQFNIWNFGEDNYITSCNCIFFLWI